MEMGWGNVQWTHVILHLTLFWKLREGLRECKSARVQERAILSCSSIISLFSEACIATMTHWSIGQICQIVGGACENEGSIPIGWKKAQFEYCTIVQLCNFISRSLHLLLFQCSVNPSPIWLWNLNVESDIEWRQIDWTWFGDSASIHHLPPKLWVNLIVINFIREGQLATCHCLSVYLSIATQTTIKGTQEAK